MFSSGFSVALIGLAVLQAFLPDCEAQLTFTPGWKHRILNKDISSRSEHSGGKRAPFWNAFRMNTNGMDKRSSMEDVEVNRGTANNDLSISPMQSYYFDKELDKLCRLLETHLARLYLADGNTRTKMLWEALWERVCDSSAQRT